MEWLMKLEWMKWSPALLLFRHVLSCSSREASWAGLLLWGPRRQLWAGGSSSAAELSFHKLILFVCFIPAVFARPPSIELSAPQPALLSLNSFSISLFLFLLCGAEAASCFSLWNQLIDEAKESNVSCSAAKQTHEINDCERIDWMIVCAVMSRRLL